MCINDEALRRANPVMGVLIGVLMVPCEAVRNVHVSLREQGMSTDQAMKHCVSYGVGVHEACTKHCHAGAGKHLVTHTHAYTHIHTHVPVS